MINNRPCSIVEISTSKTDKHGNANVHIVAHDIFTGEKFEDVCASTQNMNVPRVSRKDFQLINVEDGFAVLMSTKGTNDTLFVTNNVCIVKLQQENASAEIKIKQAEILKKIAGNENFFVTLMTACAEDMVVDWKV